MSSFDFYIADRIIQSDDDDFFPGIMPSTLHDVELYRSNAHDIIELNTERFSEDYTLVTESSRPHHNPDSFVRKVAVKRSIERLMKGWAPMGLTEYTFEVLNAGNLTVAQNGTINTRVKLTYTVDFGQDAVGDILATDKKQRKKQLLKYLKKNKSGYQNSCGCCKRSRHILSLSNGNREELASNRKEIEMAIAFDFISIDATRTKLKRVASDVASFHHLKYQDVDGTFAKQRPTRFASVLSVGAEGKVNVRLPSGTNEKYKLLVKEAFAYWSLDAEFDVMTDQTLPMIDVYFSIPSNYIIGLAQFVTNPTDLTVSRASIVVSLAHMYQDNEDDDNYIKFVLAHEIGHILGFRHNFAASYADTLQSVMDYTRREESVFPEPNQKLSYDEKCWGTFYTDGVSQRSIVGTDNSIEVNAQPFDDVGKYTIRDLTDKLDRLKKELNKSKTEKDAIETLNDVYQTVGLITLYIGGYYLDNDGKQRVVSFNDQEKAYSAIKCYMSFRPSSGLITLLKNIDEEAVKIDFFGPGFDYHNRTPIDVKQLVFVTQVLAILHMLNRVPYLQTQYNNGQHSKKTYRSYCKNLQKVVTNEFYSAYSDNFEIVNIFSAETGMSFNIWTVQIILILIQLYLPGIVEWIINTTMRIFVFLYNTMKKAYKRLVSKSKETK
jgi:predicted Zn-dependent protease